MKGLEVFLLILDLGRESSFLFPFYPAPASLGSFTDLGSGFSTHEPRPTAPASIDRSHRLRCSRLRWPVEKGLGGSTGVNGVVRSVDGFQNGDRLIYIVPFCFELRNNRGYIHST